MKTGNVRLAIIAVASVAAIGIVLGSLDSVVKHGGAGAFAMVVLFGVLGVGVVSGFRYLTARKRAQLEVTSDGQYRELAEEYRRLADLAITSQEHTELKMGEVSAQLDHLRAQNEALQKILRDVD
jgi:hypothetical protein